MRYVIVCLLKGDILEFHEKLVEDVCHEFKVERQKLPAHFTIKAPFESDNIKELEEITDKFCRANAKTTMKISGLGHFRDNVVFMDIHPSKRATEVHDNYIDQLKGLHWLEWKNNDGKNKKFHCTIVSKRIKDKFNMIWDYVSNFSPDFQFNFDNISILIWKNGRWETYKEYMFKD